MLRHWMCIVLVVTLLASPVLAWHQQGHEAITRAAVESLPDTSPVFLRENAAIIAHCSVDADVARNRLTPQLTRATGLEHYFDLELVDVENLPEDRFKFLTQLAEKNIQPRDVGLGLYALIETRQKLTIALAEYRKWPQNKAIQMKCLVYAGQVAHLAADLSQPLHTSVHHDGRLDADGRSPRSGIHEKVDDLLDRMLKADAASLQLPEAIQPRVYEPGVKPVLATILQTHKLVDRVYELEAKLPAMDAPLDQPLDGEVRQFAMDRYSAAATFTASMLLTAWEDSAAIELPAWLDRDSE